ASAELTVGTNGSMLVADSTQTLGLKWAYRIDGAPPNIIAIGQSAGAAFVSGSQSVVAIGANSFKSATTAKFSVGYGYNSGSNQVTGDSNTYLGYGAGGGCTTGNTNVAIGFNARLGGSVANAIQLGTGTNSTDN